MTEKQTGGPAFPGEQDVNYPSMTATEKHQGMTLRQYAAIKLKVPDSGADWLDEMITKSLRDDFEGKAMKGLIVAFPDWTHNEIANASCSQADAMLEARK